MYLGTAEADVDSGVVTGWDKYNEPLPADSSWWQGMYKVLRDDFTWVGSHKAFVYGLQEFGNKLLRIYSSQT